MKEIDKMHRVDLRREERRERAFRGERRRERRLTEREKGGT